MILITGSNGQLGTELRQLLDEKSIAYIATDAAEMDITDKAAVDSSISRSKTHSRIIIVQPIQRWTKQKMKEKN